MDKQNQRPHVQEIYMLDDELTKDRWLKLNKAIVGQLGTFGGRYEIVLRLKDNIVRFFVIAERDLSSLSNSIDGVVFRSGEPDDIRLPDQTTKEGFVQFVTGGNILDLKEKYQVKKEKSLEYVTLKIRAFSHDKMLLSGDLYFKAGNSWSKSHKSYTSFPYNLFEINFATNTHYLKKTVPKYLNIEKSVHMLSSENMGALVEVDTFPYFSHNYYLGLANYEFDKHSFIIGASGSGKSKFISLFVDRLAKMNFAMNYRVIVVDPHASLADDFEHIENKQVVNFSGESTQLFGGSASDISAATELTATLLKSLMTGQASPKTDRVLRFSLYVLLTAQTMSLESLKRFLTDIGFRNQVLDHVREYVPSNIVHFFGADFNEMRTKYYDEALSPIISLVDEMQMQPALVGEGELSLERIIQENYLTVFSLNKVSMGERVVKTVAGLLIQQIFLLAQARAFNERVILIIDEVSVVQNPALAAILSEARKFNLTVILTQQYFGQIEVDLRAAIFANVFNYYTFKVSEEDARELEGNLNIELPEEIVAAENAKGVKEKDLRVKIMTELHPRECLVRVVSRGQMSPAVKARTLDAPTVPEHRGEDAPKLKSYTQKPVSLPQKFQEKPAGSVAKALPQLEATPTNQPSAPLEQPEGDWSFDPNTQSLQVPAVTAFGPETLGQSPEAAPEMFGAYAEQPTNPEGELLPSRYETDPEERETVHANKLGNAAVAPISQSLPAQTFNLGEILASHSSSRIKVNERKDA